MNLEDLYKKIPKSKCKDGCFTCCSNSVQFTPSEYKSMGGYSFDAESMCCSHLVNGKCSVYENRPFVCRLFGTSELLECEHCTPERVLTQKETNDLVHEYVLIKNKEKTKND